MNKKHFYSLTICLSVMLLQSCKVQKVMFSEGNVEINQEKQILDISYPNISIKLHPLYANVMEKKDIIVYSKNHDLTSSTLKKYFNKTLKFAHTTSDSIIVLIPSKMAILKNNNINYDSMLKKADYLYKWDFESHKWVVFCLDNKLNMNKNDNVFSFCRYIYKNKKYDILIVKDVFPLISVVYFMQRYNKRTKNLVPPIFFTKSWSPMAYKNFIMTASFIEKIIDPFSKQIAFEIYGFINNR